MSASETRSFNLWRRLRGNRPALFGLALIVLLGGAAVLAPLLPLADPAATSLDQRFASALSPGHPLGTDHLGRDLLSRLVWGTRSSLAVGLTATAVAAVVGTLLGLVAGYVGRWLDTTLMRGIDVLMAFPYLLLALAIVAALGPGLRNAMLAIAVVNIPFFARSVRGAVVALKHRPFIDAARLLGFSARRILFSEILPNVLPAIVVMMATTLGWMVLETAGLSFLGLGAQPPQADLGSMLGQSREFLTTVPRVALLPGLVILVLVIGINLFGDGLRDALDVRTAPLAAGVQAVIRHDAPSAAPVTSSIDAPLLAVDGLRIEFPGATGTVTAVDDLGFTLAAGERLALVGESGCGKTQSALALLGLVSPPGRVAAGRIRYRAAHDVQAGEAHWRRLRGTTVAYIPQDPMTALDPLFTVAQHLIETLRVGRRLPRAAARAEALALLEQVAMPDPRETLDAYPHELSGGMRQRVMIALGIARAPALLIADEATTALDVTVQSDILALLDRLCRERDMALLFITHDLALVGALCERVIVMYAGRPVERLSVGRLLDGPAHPYTRALLACTPVLGQSQRELPPIPGAPPSLVELSHGCHFAPRCPYHETACNQRMPLRAIQPGWDVRCHRAEELLS